MDHLIVYGTIEGHTRKVATTIADQITAAGETTLLLDASERISDLAMPEFRSCIVTAPVHQKRHPDTVTDFVRANLESLNNMSSALVSVSLAAAFPDGHKEAQSYVDRIVDRTGWTPKAVHLSAGALRSAEYDFFTEQIIRHIVLKDRENVEIEGDQEFTDWPALTQFVDEFLATA